MKYAFWYSVNGGPRRKAETSLGSSDRDKAERAAEDYWYNGCFGNFEDDLTFRLYGSDNDLTHYATFVINAYEEPRFQIARKSS